MVWPPKRTPIVESPDRRRERRRSELLGIPLVGGTGVMLIVQSIHAYQRDGWAAEVFLGGYTPATWWVLDLGGGVLAVLAALFVAWLRLREKPD